VNALEAREITDHNMPPEEDFPNDSLDYIYDKIRAAAYHGLSSITMPVLEISFKQYQRVMARLAGEGYKIRHKTGSDLVIVATEVSW
jgi:hypothetical protein